MSGLSHSFAGSVLGHYVPKIFSLTRENISPLCQTKWYCSPSCQVLNVSPDIKCSEFLKTETKENIVLIFSDIEKYCVILMDEMKIQGNLVWDKHASDLTDFVDLNYATSIKK